MSRGPFLLRQMNAILKAVAKVSHSLLSHSCSHSVTHSVTHSLTDRQRPLQSLPPEVVKEVDAFLGKRQANALVQFPKGHAFYFSKSVLLLPSPSTLSTFLSTLLYLSHCYVPFFLAIHSLFMVVILCFSRPLHPHMIMMCTCEHTHTHTHIHIHIHADEAVVSRVQEPGEAVPDSKVYILTPFLLFTIYPVLY
jgi:hypothetical protein